MLIRLLMVFISMVLIIPVTMADIKVDFDRTNQTYDWLTQYNHTINRPGFEFITSFNGQSNLVRGKTNRWQENATARFVSEKSVITRLSLVTSAEYTVNGLDKRRVRSSELAAGISYHPWQYFEIRPLIKAERIKRSDLESGRNDQGAGYGIEGKITPARFSVIDLAASFSFDKLNLTNIPSNSGNGQLNAAARFSRGDTLSFSIKGLENSKKYYSSTGKTDNIVRQIKQEREGAFSASINLPASFRLRSDANAQLSRYLYRYSSLEESASPQRDNYGKGGGYKIGIENYAGKTALTMINYTWKKSNQDYQGTQLDQKTEVGELSIQGKVRLSERDSVTADVFFGVTSYSNPSVNSKRYDRDQKAIVVNGRASHVFSGFFKVGLTGGVSSFHQIYISGTQSANNGQNDTYILTPFTEWRPADKLLVVQSFEIQANYITFDYDRKKIATRNRIFRRATARTDMRFIISQRLTWEQAYLYRYEDYGQLIWDEGWQQAVSWDRRKIGLESKLIYAPVSGFRISPSFGWEKTNDYSHSVETDTESEVLNEIRKLSDEQVKLLYAIELAIDWTDSRRMRAEFSHRLRKFMERDHENTDYAAVTMELFF